MFKLLLLLVTLFIASPAFAATKTSAATGNFDAGGTWVGGVAPVESDDIVIASGHVVTVTASPPMLGTVMSMGRLVFSNVPLTFTAKWMMAHMVGGTIEAGALNLYRTATLVITLYGDVSETVPGMGARVIGAMGGGKIQMLGAAPVRTWVMLNADAPVGATTITVESDITGWNIGDEIGITTTSLDWNETERRTITARTGKIITLNVPLTYAHYGTKQVFQHRKAGVPKVNDERAEVLRITGYPIKIQGSADSDASQFGGHGMIMETASIGLFQGVEFYRMGQFGRLGRYPIHWHNVNDGGVNSFIRKCSVNGSYNRGMTVHKTNYLRLTDNVLIDTKGFGYFIEDGKEIRNVFTRCLATRVMDGALDVRTGVQAIPFPSAFWISNPNNDFIDCVAAGMAGQGIGFWYDIPTNPRLNSISHDLAYFPKLQPMGVFRGNRIHGINNAHPEGNGDFGLGGWGVGIQFDNGTNNHIFEDTTFFKIHGVGFYADQMLAGSATYTRTRSSIDFVAFKGNTYVTNSLCVSANKSSNLPTAYTGSVVVMGYDGTPQVRNSVVNGFLNTLSQPGFFRASSPTFLDKCQMIDSSITYGPSLPRDRFVLMLSDPDDSFGNGSAGTFINQLYAIDGAVPNPQGVHVSDTETHWSPLAFQQVRIFTSLLDTITIDSHAMVQQSYGDHLGVFALDVVYRLNPTGEESGRISTFESRERSRHATANQMMRFVFTKPTDFVEFRYERDPPYSAIPVAANFPAWEAATTNSMFDDGTDIYLALKSGFADVIYTP